MAGHQESIFEPLDRVEGIPLIIAHDNFDTDQIYPARFLSVTGRSGLGAYALHDWRRDANGQLISGHPFNLAGPERFRILLVGRNFGCGSSREHAPWALYDLGVRLVLGVEIADIFRSNCLNNGIAALCLETEQHAELMACPNHPISVDLGQQVIELQTGSRIGFALDPLAKLCLISGRDTLEQLLSARTDIAGFEQGLRVD